jgi:hypothetical protein
MWHKTLRVCNVIYKCDTRLWECVMWSLNVTQESECVMWSINVTQDWECVMWSINVTQDSESV